MGRTITPKQRKKIITMKQKAIYRKPEKRFLNRYQLKRRRIDKLAKAWMQYVDYLGIDKYRPKNFHYKGNHGGSQCTFTDDLFTVGERAVITRYLKEKGLIDIDNWNFYIVKWRKNNGKKKTTDDQ